MHFLRMGYLAYILLALLILIPSGIMHVASAQEQDTGSGALVVKVEKVVPSLGTKLEDWCGVTFEFLPDGRMICGELRGGQDPPDREQYLDPRTPYRAGYCNWVQGTGHF